MTSRQQDTAIAKHLIKERQRLPDVNCKPFHIPSRVKTSFHHQLPGRSSTTRCIVVDQCDTEEVVVKPATIHKIILETLPSSVDSEVSTIPTFDPAFDCQKDRCITKITTILVIANFVYISTYCMVPLSRTRPH